MKDGSNGKLKIWLLETRPQFLLLSPVLAFLGNALAWYDGVFSVGRGLFAFVGLLLLHISVNTLNDYFDYRSGIDYETEETSFSGGSGFLTSNSLKPKHVLWFGLTCFVLALPIGIYFVVTSGWLLLPLILVGSLSVLLYTPLITKFPWPEWSPGLGLGSLPILGFYFIQASSYPLHVFVASILSGILVHNLLLLNEFPDIKPDKEEGGRKTLPIILGRENASLIFSITTIFVYLWIIIAPALNQIPITCLITLATLPIALKTIQNALKYGKKNKILSAMKYNVLTVFLTQILFGVGFIISGLSII